jgi:hypothetical protein
MKTTGATVHKKRGVLVIHSFIEHHTQQQQQTQTISNTRPGGTSSKASKSVHAQMEANPFNIILAYYFNCSCWWLCWSADSPTSSGTESLSYSSMGKLSTALQFVRPSSPIAALSYALAAASSVSK